jgi:hypothetical protein
MGPASRRLARQLAPVALAALGTVVKKLDDPIVRDRLRAAPGAARTRLQDWRLQREIEASASGKDRLRDRVGQPGLERRARAVGDVVTSLRSGPEAQVLGAAALKNLEYSVADVELKLRVARGLPLAKRVRAQRRIAASLDGIETVLMDLAGLRDGGS